ncbi:MAG: transporter [Alphaproteobacteria bacterium]|nr:transporter [Alphaproteobacteria bacterium]
MANVLELTHLRHSYPQGENGRLQILHDISLHVARGEIVALMGKSGAGKSTLLHMAGLLDRPEEGEVRIAGNVIVAADDAVRTQLRQKSIGFIYQFHHLLPEFSAMENVLLPQIAAKTPRAEAVARSEALLRAVKLEHRIKHRPSQLSGGEQQRVAIARALANKPHLLLADEPTGNLDPETADTVFDLLLNTIRQENVGALIATHNPELAKRMDRILVLDHGRVVE